MTFNKAKEELKWKCWKDKEEKVLRKSGMEESSIEILRQMDWEDFNAERRYREHIAVGIPFRKVGANCSKVDQESDGRGKGCAGVFL